jgi:hypothetical protein
MVGIPIPSRMVGVPFPTSVPCPYLHLMGVPVPPFLLSYGCPRS